MQIVDIVHILYLEEILSVLLKIKHQINTLTRLNVVFSLKTMYILRMPFPLDIDQLGEASKKSSQDCDVAGTIFLFCIPFHRFNCL